MIESIVKSARKKHQNVQLITGEHIRQCFAEKGNDDLDFIKDIACDYTVDPNDEEKDGSDDDRTVSKKGTAVVPNYSKIYKRKESIKSVVVDDKQGTNENHQMKKRKNPKDDSSTSTQGLAKKNKLTKDRDLEQFLNATDLERYKETNPIRGNLNSDEIIEDDEDYD